MYGSVYIKIPLALHTSSFPAITLSLIYLSNYLHFFTPESVGKDTSGISKRL